MGFFLFFVLPWLSALSLSDKDIKSAGAFLDEAAESLMFIIRPFIVIGMIALPFVGTWLFFHGYGGSGSLYHTELGWLYWVAIAPLFPVSIYLIVRVIFCGITNMKRIRNRSN